MEQSSAIERLRTIKTGDGIQHILDSAFEIMGNPAVIFDMSYTMTAHTKNADNDDPIWTEFMTRGQLSDKTIEFFKYEAFIEAVADCLLTNGVTFLNSEALKYRRVFGQIYNKNHLPAADLCIVECFRSFDADILDQVRVVCDLISEEVGASEHYISYGQMYQESIINTLIENENIDKGIYSGNLAHIYYGLKRTVFAAVILRPDGKADIENLSRSKETLVTAMPDFKFSLYGEHIVALISCDKKTLNVKKDLAELGDILRIGNLYAGVSRGFENLFLLKDYYGQALSALKAGLAKRGNQRIFLSA